MLTVLRYTPRTNALVPTRNSRMQRNMSAAKPIPEEFIFNNKTYVCTHSGAPRRSVGQGTRPHQHSRRIGCKAQTNAWGPSGRSSLRNKTPSTTREVYKIYHEPRQVSDSAVLDTVRTLHRAGANRKRIMEYFMENTTAEPTMKDIHNIAERLKKESYSFHTVEERISAILEDFASQKGNLTRVYANAGVRMA
eukprot:jgi/Phyca11/125609/e_gw1.59.233.1